MEKYLTCKECAKILEPLYEKCPQTMLLRIGEEGKVKKEKLIAVVIAAICSPICELHEGEEMLYSPNIRILLQKEGILEGVCDDVSSWIERGAYITKKEAQIIVDNTCEYLSKQN